MTFHCGISTLEDGDIPLWNLLEDTMEHTSRPTASHGSGAAPSPTPTALRVSDAEREVIVDELGRHLTAGRLTISEFDERVAQVYRATTQKEATAVLDDLPPAPSPAGHTERTPRRGRLPLHQRVEWSAWLAVGSINLVVWALVSLGTGSMIYFWPVWVIVPWGLVLAVRSALGIEGGPGRHPAIMPRHAVHPHCGRSSRTWH